MKYSFSDKSKEELLKIIKKEDLSKTISDYSENLFESSDFADLKIILGEEVIFVHKNIVCCLNDFFKSYMQKHPMEEEIKLSEDPGNFKIFLRYLYTKKIDDEDICKELLVLASKYGDSELVKICVNKLCQIVDDQNCLELLEVASTYQYHQLSRVCSKHFVDNYCDLIENNEKVSVIQKDMSIAKEIFESFQETVQGRKLNINKSETKVEEKN